MILIGDCLEQLRTLPDESVNCCVTSPPYFGLRDYGTPGQLGLESTPEEYVANMVDVFREVRRVLRADGTVWLNLGDSYASQGGLHDGRDDNQPGVGAKRAWRDGSGRADGIVDARGQRNRNGNAVPGLKPKDLVGIPWRVAFALQADGWYLRSDIIWAKPNPMPESVRDRPTKAHEYVFLLAKSERYYYDQDAIRTEIQDATIGRQKRADATFYEPDGQSRHTGIRAYKTPDGWDTGKGAHGTIHREGREKGKVLTPDSYKGSVPGRNDGPGQERRSKNDRSGQRTKADLNGNWDAQEAAGTLKGANARTVWTIATQPYKEAHFATYPEELPKRCILAGCPEGGTVLDPFLGSGTTVAVAISLGRKGIGIELNPEYAELARKRISGVTPAFNFEEAV